MFVIIGVCFTMLMVGACTMFYADPPTHETYGTKGRLKAYISEIGSNRWAACVIFGLYMGAISYFAPRVPRISDVGFFNTTAAIVCFVSSLVPYLVLVLWWRRQGDCVKEMLPFLLMLVLVWLVSSSATSSLWAMLGFTKTAFAAVLAAFLLWVPFALFAISVAFLIIFMFGNAEK